MSTDRDTTRTVRSWLEEGVTALPDRVLDAVLDQVPATPQRRPWWPPRRFADMNKLLPAAIAAAAVLVVAVVGYTLLPGTGGPGGPQTPTPPPVTAAPTAEPTTKSSIPPVGSASLTPGRHAWYWSGPPVSFEVPEGWTGRLTSIVKHQDQPNELGWEVWLPGSRPVTAVFTDACHSEGALEPITQTVDGLVAALDAQAGTDATITDMTGQPAKRIDLTASAGLDRSTCRDGADGPLRVWADPGETDFYVLAGGYRGFVHAVDVGGNLVVLAGGFGPEVAAADIAELETIVASLQVGP
jgi:hypothetical protein